MCSFQYKLFTMDVHHTIVLIVLQFPVSWSLCNMYTLSMVDSVFLQKVLFRNHNLVAEIIEVYQPCLIYTLKPYICVIFDNFKVISVCL